jgi:hypothetical protein
MTTANSTTSSPYFNRFHAIVLFFWQFANFLLAQQLFGIFANYIPRWRCNQIESSNFTLTLQFSRECQIYAECPRPMLEFEQSPFASAAIEFDWICGNGVFLRAFYSQVNYKIK